MEPLKESTPHYSQSKNIKLGVLFALLGSFCNATMSVFVKLIGTGQSTASVTFARFAVGLIIISPWILLTEKNLWSTTHLGKLFVRSVTTLLAIATFLYALKYIPLTTTVVLNNTFPLFTPILAFILLKVKSPPIQWASVVIGFIGVVLVLQPCRFCKFVC